MSEGHDLGSEDGPSHSNPMMSRKGLINGVPLSEQSNGTRGSALFGRSKKKEKAAREALGRKAEEPLPGSGGE
jgi:hypothetical protein